MTHLKTVAALAAVTLSACGGSTMSSQDVLEARDTRGDEIFDTFVDGQDILASDALPSTGSASYTGPLVALGGVGDPALNTEQVRVAFVGNAQLNVDFAGASLSGTVDDFIDVENVEEFNENDVDLVSGGDVSGSLTITGTQATGADASFDLRATGELNGPNGSFLDFVDVAGVADVFGADADALEIFGGADVQFDNQDGFIAYSGVAAQ